MKKYIFTILFLLVLGLSFFAYHKHEVRVKSMYTPNILSIGDSVTGGMVDSKGLWATNYAFSLAEIFFANGYRPNFIGGSTAPMQFGAQPINFESHGAFCIAENWQDCNLSPLGTKLENNTLLGNLDSMLVQRFEPNIIILQGGINDINVNQGNPGVMGDPASSMLKMIAKVKAKYPKATILVLPVFEYGHNEIKSAVEKFNNDVSRDLNTQKTAIFVNIPNISEKRNFFADGIHPNKEGYKVIGENIYLAIEKQKILP